MPPFLSVHLATSTGPGSKPFPSPTTRQRDYTHTQPSFNPPSPSVRVRLCMRAVVSLSDDGPRPLLPTHTALTRRTPPTPGPRPRPHSTLVVASIPMTGTYPFTCAEMGDGTNVPNQGEHVRVWVDRRILLSTSLEVTIGSWRAIEARI